MNKEERRHQIIQLIEESDGAQILGTRELAEQFGVSEMTVRRDLQQLSMDGRLRRQHGGAAAPFRQPYAQNRKEIGILLASKTGKYSDPFFNAVLEGADRKLLELGYRIAYINTSSEVNTAEQVRDLLESTAAQGMILVGPRLGVEGIDYLKANMRALVGTIDTIGDEFDIVTFDGYKGIRDMVDHLVKHGYRRLGFITGDHDFRRQAFMDGVKAHGLPDEEELCLTVVPFHIEGWIPELGHKGTQQLMELANPPDAIVCASDRIAIGAIQWLHQHGFRVPHDIAVTGFDNIAESAFTSPSLTTVHVHKERIGELAAERVVKCIENEYEIPLLIRTPTNLVIRQSCGSHAETAQ